MTSHLSATSPHRNANTASDHELDKFEKLASDWWNPQGPFKQLHRFTPARLQFILEAALKYHPKLQGKVAILEHIHRPYYKKSFFDCARFRKKGIMPALASLNQPLAGTSILDVGTGGGILAEKLALLGARVTGIDLVARNIAIAQQHAKESHLLVDYRQEALESLIEKNEMFDIVIASEVIEHVSDPSLFSHQLASVCKDKGLIFVSTFNRSAFSFVFGILAAEYLLRMLPRGTHSWKKFIKPKDLESMLRLQNCHPKESAGITYIPLTGSFVLTDSLDVNYILVAQKGC